MPEKPKRLSDVVVAGVDYPAKVKITEVLDHEVLLLGFDVAISVDIAPDIDPETGEITPREYYNIRVDDNDVLKTFSTGAIPIVKVLRSLEQKVAQGEAELPLLCSFRKEGRTYVIE